MAVHYLEIVSNDVDTLPRLACGVRPRSNER